jgi:hypothetical protein
MPTKQTCGKESKKNEFFKLFFLKHYAPMNQIEMHNAKRIFHMRVGTEWKFFVNFQTSKDFGLAASQHQYRIFREISDK